MVVVTVRITADISTHALREEGDEKPTISFHPSFYFYPRPPRGGRPKPSGASGGCRRISTHALREEGDGTAGG